MQGVSVDLPCSKRTTDLYPESDAASFYRGFSRVCPIAGAYYKTGHITVNRHLYVGFDHRFSFHLGIIPAQSLHFPREKHRSESLGEEEGGRGACKSQRTSSIPRTPSASRGASRNTATKQCQRAACQALIGQATHKLPTIGPITGPRKTTDANTLVAIPLVHGIPHVRNDTRAVGEGCDGEETT